MFIAWTTLPTKEQADRLAAAAVKEGLAACAQVEGPVTSHYRWNGQLETAQEFRVTFKCIAKRLPELEIFVLKAHPYDTPEWIAVRADHVGEKYLSWANANPTNLPL